MLFDQLHSLSRLQRFVLGLLVVGSAWLSIDFLVLPLFMPTDAVIYNRTVDRRLGGHVRRQVLASRADLATAAISLEPDDTRKEYSISSPGTVHFYGKRNGDQPNEIARCRYESSWRASALQFFQLRPSAIRIVSCSDRGARSASQPF